MFDRGRELRFHPNVVIVQALPAMFQRHFTVHLRLIQHEGRIANPRPFAAAAIRMLHVERVCSKKRRLPAAP